MSKKIGLSLSLCIRDIMQGTVGINQIACIITNTRAQTEAQWEKIITEYHRVCWSNETLEWARALIGLLRKEGKIIQPRLDDPDHTHTVNRGHWLDLPA